MKLDFLNNLSVKQKIGLGIVLVVLAVMYAFVGKVITL
jgi:hypothetical protein